jgi:hypothetical protein
MTPLLSFTVEAAAAENRGLTSISHYHPLIFRAPSREMGCLTSVFRSATVAPFENPSHSDPTLIGARP